MIDQKLDHPYSKKKTKVNSFHYHQLHLAVVLKRLKLLNLLVFIIFDKMENIAETNNYDTVMASNDKFTSLS